MKRILILLLAPTLLIAQGIKFENGTLYQLLSKAKSQNKLIFLDAYATWCGPCKRMDKLIFPDANVGAYFNANFINAKFNMEEGEGLLIAKDYKVDAYPTLLFIDGDGKLVHKSVGSIEPEELISLGKEALNPDNQLSLQIKKYNEGNRDPDFLYNLAYNALKNEDENSKTYARAFYKAQKNLLKLESIVLMYITIDSPQSEEFIYLQKNEAEIAKLIESNEISNKLDMVVIEYAEKEINKSEILETRIKKFENNIAKYRPSKALELSLLYGYTEAQNQIDILVFEKLVSNYLDKYLDNLNADSLNSTAWKIFEESSNVQMIEKALKWAIKSVSLDSNFYNNDTVANLYNKLGDKNNAKIYAQISIKLGKESGYDTSETEALLLKLK